MFMKGLRTDTFIIINKIEGKMCRQLGAKETRPVNITSLSDILNAAEVGIFSFMYFSTYFRTVI